MNKMTNDILNFQRRKQNFYFKFRDDKITHTIFQRQKEYLYHFDSFFLYCEGKQCSIELTQKKFFYFF